MPLLRWKPRMFLALAALALALAAFAGSPGPSSPAPGVPRVPVLIELYTSEGCSSCPPADALLDALDRTQPVKGVEAVTLGFHVDYWNNLGWADPFSSPEHTVRQSQANEALNRNSIFTPQALVNGRVSLVGSEEGALQRTLATERERPRALVTLSAGIRGDGLELSTTVDQVPALVEGEVAEVWAAVTEAGLSTEVQRGENAGRTLRHAPVVRRLAQLGTLPASGPLTARLPLEPGWRRDRLKAVVFVQERSHRRVLGVTAAALAPEPVTASAAPPGGTPGRSPSGATPSPSRQVQ